MNREGSTAVGATVATWGLAMLAVSAALELLWGWPRLVGAGAAVAIAMFVNDIAPVESLFSRSRRPWLWAGTSRAVTALAGFGIILYMGFEFAHGYNARIVFALFAGFLLGGVAGSAVRLVRDMREARRKGRANSQ